jgi:dihydrofolate reductase
LDAAVRFIKEQLEGNQAKTDAKEDDVRDMELPF